jgi:hypothetical protein
MIRYRVNPKTGDINRMEMLLEPFDTDEYYFKCTYTEAKCSLLNLISDEVNKLKALLNKVKQTEYPS